MAGRPTVYDPAFCELAIELGKQGKSITVIAARIGVNKDTVYNWVKLYPEFSDAISLAKTLSQEWWEDAGQNALGAEKFQTGVWTKSMAARFPDDWRDSVKTEHSGTLAVEAITRTIVDPA